MTAMTPNEIVSELDKHIVGQNNAKKAVAIALRNRWRRAQVAEPLKSELTALGIRIADLTGVKSDDSLGHGKFSSSPLVVQAIGKHLSAGHQFSSGAGGSLAYRAGALLTGTASVIVNVPLAIVDKDSQEELKRSLDAVGAPEIAGHPAQSEAPKAKEP